jgi:quinoprotein glucose dehydrogenase
MPFIVALVPQNVKSGDDQTVPDTWADMPQYETRYAVNRRPFLSEKGIPCLKPPWGSLVAIDLNSGAVVWRKPLGSLYGRVPVIGSMLKVGAPISGGVMQTAGGIAFVGASIDEHFWAYDTDSGELLWNTHLPYSAHATPMTYRLRQDARQFVVIATGGADGLDLRTGNTLVAFALPDRH